MNTSNTNNTDVLKVVLGIIIFAFSLAFAYFLAAYTDRHLIFDYWGTLIIFAGLYIVVGIVIVNIFPISLGFLFSADILVLHALMENFGDLNEGVKALIIGLMLVVLYLIAWIWFPDSKNRNQEEKVSAPSTNKTEPTIEISATKTEPAQPVVDLDLNDRLQKVNIAGVQKVIFYPSNMQAFSTSEPNIIRIALYTKQLLGKTQFQPSELNDLYMTFMNSYTTTLPENKVKIVIEKMKNFVMIGGRFEVI
ncbi:MAG: hypothetical protein V1712_03860 [Patescibacteria group bacterium]